MNGLQSLTQWKDYFNNPSKGNLGLLNAIQVRIIFPQVYLYLTDLTIPPEYWCSSRLPLFSLPL
jgi:hypothetical protein